MVNKKSTTTKNRTPKKGSISIEKKKRSQLKEIDLKDYREVSYLDVFKRIADYLSGGDAYVNVGDVYATDVYEGCSTYDEIDIEDDVVQIDIGDESGDCVLEWKCVKSFLTAETSEDGYLLNIFNLFEYWNHKYERLDRCTAIFYEKFKSLQNIKPKDFSPKGIMKCLDLNGI